LDCPYAKAAGDSNCNPRDPDRHLLSTHLGWYSKDRPGCLESRNKAKDDAGNELIFIVLHHKTSIFEGCDIPFVSDALPSSLPYSYGSRL